MIYLTNINLNQNELQNAVIQPLATAPANPKLYQIYTDSTNGKIKQYDGTEWKTVGVVVESSATNGSITVDGVEMTVYTLPAATASSLGGVKVGTGLNVQADGTISVNASAPTWAEILNKPENLVQDADYVHTDNNYTTADAAKIAEIDDKLDLSGGAMTGAIAMGSNKITGLANGTDDNDAVTKSQLDAARVGALRPSGSIAFANLPALAVGVLHCLYNITDEFTTTADFVEGAGNKYPAGTNVAIINTGTDESPVYKYDAMTGVIDLSGYAKTEDLSTVATSGDYDDLSNKPTLPSVNTGTLSTTTATVTATGTTVVSVLTVDSVTYEQVICDVSINGKNVTVTVAAAPTNPIAITVLSI